MIPRLWPHSPVLFLTLILGACNLFETRDFIPVSVKTIALSLLPDAATLLKFRYEERLRWTRGGILDDTLLGTGEIRLTRIGQDSLHQCQEMTRSVVGGGTLAGRLDTICLSQGDGGWLALGRLGSGGEVLPSLQPMDSTLPALWKLLPPGLETGNQWHWVHGNVEVKRSLAGHDTLEHGTALAEAWHVRESLLVTGEAWSSGDYWYGGNGLLLARWEYPAFIKFSARAENEGEAKFYREVRRIF